MIDRSAALALSAHRDHGVLDDQILRAPDPRRATVNTERKEVPLVIRDRPICLTERTLDLPACDLNRVSDMIHSKPPKRAVFATHTLP